MVRAATKSCPNLTILFEDAEPNLVAGFLSAKPFERLTWLSQYNCETDPAMTNEIAGQMLDRERKEKLGPLETEAARVITISGNRGQFALEGLARTKLRADRLISLLGQRDELARSLWAYVHEAGLFDATENSLHLRLYRRFDRHYQTFMAEPSLKSALDDDAELVERILKEIKVQLNRGEGYSIDRFDIPGDGEDSDSLMYLLFHPNPPTSARELDETGNRSRFYFRPPGEAMIVYTPSTGRVHVRAGTRTLRHQIAAKFVKTVLKQVPSSQPVDFQAYDISKFRSVFDLDRPAFDDVEIKAAKIIRLEVSVHNLASRLSISTSIDGNLALIVEKQSGLGRILERAIATRFLEIAVRYRRTDQDETRTLDFAVTDRNTCSLLSVDDPFERVLGHRLLQHWRIMREGRAPSGADSMQALPALLDLWDMGQEVVSGAWLSERQIETALLIDIGFLVSTGSDEDDDGDLIDDEESIGPNVAEVVSRPEGLTLKSSPGQEALAGSADRYRAYRVRKDWVAQHLQAYVAAKFGNSEPVTLDADLIALGVLHIRNREVPIYLTRGLDDEKRRADVDTKLRERKGGGIGLVMQAGNSFGLCLAGNVLTRLADHLEGPLPDLSLSLKSLESTYVEHHVLAMGGQVVEFVPIGVSAGTLFVPGKGNIDISGEHRVRLIKRLVDAHNSGPSTISSDDLRQGITDQSLANIFGQLLWDKLKADFIRSPKRPLWEIAI